MLVQRRFPIQRDEELMSVAMSWYVCRLNAEDDRVLWNSFFKAAFLESIGRDMLEGRYKFYMDPVWRNENGL